MHKTINKISYLDGLRGVAAFVVVIHHFLLAFYYAYYSGDEQSSHLGGWDVAFGRSVVSVFANGNFCVFIFFVLSGFVLSRKYFKENSMEILVSGAQRRFVRLYVPVAVTLTLSFILMQCHLYYNKPLSVVAHSEWWFGTQWGFGHVWQQFLQSLLYKTMFTQDSLFDTTMWTMSIEFYGSLFVFAFLALSHNTRNRLGMLLIVLLYCFISNSPFKVSFLLGITLNYLEAHRNELSARLLVWAPAVLLAAGLVLGSFPTSNVTVHTIFSPIPARLLPVLNANWAHTAGAYLLVVAFVLSHRLQRLMSLRLFIFLGYISFAIYLVHPLVLGSVSSYAFLRIYGYTSYNCAAALTFIITLGVCVPLAWCLTKYVDDRGIKLSKKIYARFAKKSLPPGEE